VIINLRYSGGSYADPLAETCNDIFFKIREIECPKMSITEFIEWAEQHIPCHMDSKTQTIDIDESIYAHLILKYT